MAGDACPNTPSLDAQYLRFLDDTELEKLIDITLVLNGVLTTYPHVLWI